MGSTWARSEGIYQKDDNAPSGSYWLICLICQKRVNASALARGSHGKMHVREGRAVARTEYDSSGGSLRGPHVVYDFKRPAEPAIAGIPIVVNRLMPKDVVAMVGENIVTSRPLTDAETEQVAKAVTEFRFQTGHDAEPAQ